MHDDALKLTTLMAAGDPAAIEQFYECYFDLMYREAYRATNGDESTCLDVVQDSLLKILKCLRPMNSFDQLKSWTRKVVRSVAIDLLRKRRSQMQRDVHKGNETSKVNGFDESDLIHARIIWLEEQVDLLDDDSRRLLTLRYKLGWTLQRIADRLGLKPGAVDGRIRRLVDQLRQRAEANDYE